MAKLAVIGTEEFTLGFMLAGVRDVYVARTAEEIRTSIESLSDEIGILVIGQESFALLPDYLRADLMKSVRPVVVTLSKEGDGGQLRDMIMKSIGVDLWEK